MGLTKTSSYWLILPLWLGALVGSNEQTIDKNSSSVETSRIYFDNAFIGTSKFGQIQCFNDDFHHELSGCPDILIISHRDRQANPFQQRIIALLNENFLVKTISWNYARMDEFSTQSKWNIIWFIDVHDDDPNVDRLISRVVRKLFVLYNNDFTGSRIELFTRIHSTMSMNDVRFIVLNRCESMQCECEMSYGGAHIRKGCTNRSRHPTLSELKFPIAMTKCSIDVAVRTFEPYAMDGNDGRFASGMEGHFLTTVGQKYDMDFRYTPQETNRLV